MLDRSEIGTRTSAALTRMYEQENPIFKLILALAKKASGIDAAAIVHGAIRLPEGQEYTDAVKIMEACGLSLQNIYHLPEHHIIASAACPDPLAHESFRMFMSMLRVTDAVNDIIANPKTEYVAKDPERFRDQVKQAIAARPGIDRKLLTLADKAGSQDGLTEAELHAFTKGVTDWLQMDTETPIDKALYETLIAEGSDVLADVVCFKKTHLNHLTPQIPVAKNLKPMGMDIIALTAQIQAFFDLVNDSARTGNTSHEAEKYLKHILGETSWHTLGITKEDFLGWAQLRNSIEKKAAALRNPDAVQSTPQPPFNGLTMIAIQGQRQDDGIAIYLQQVSNKGVPVKVRDILHMAPFVELEQRGYWLTQAGEQYVSAPHQLQTFKTYSCQELCDKGYIYHHAGIPLKYPGFLPKNAAGIFKGNLTSGAVEEAGPYDQTQHTTRFLALLEKNGIFLDHINMHQLAARTIEKL